MIQKFLKLIFVFFVLGTLSMQAQEIRISGTVTDATDGQSLPGVNVIIKGTAKGATTDFEGRYAIEVPDTDAVLQFSFLGYMDIEVAVGNNKVIDMVLQESSESLDEVVVTAFGISREKKALGYSVTELQSESVNTVVNANVGNSLVGKVAGLVVNESGGVGSGSRIILRGNGSISGNNQALIVVDGVPINAAGTESGGSVYSSTVTGGGISDVNSEDIETISVLKGPNASALYGSRAAGGVILITTKTGKSDTGLGITVNSQIQAGNAMFVPDYQNSYGQGTNGVPYPDLEDFGGSSWGGPIDGSQQLYYTGEQEPYTAQSSNVEDFFETGWQAINFVGLDQGGDGYSVRFSYTNNYTTSHVPGSTLKSHNFNLRSTVDLVEDKLNLDAKATYFAQDLDHRVSLGTEGVLASVFPMPRTVRTSDLTHYQMDDPSIYEPGGAINDYDVISYAGPNSTTGNPYWAQDHDVNQQKRGRFFGFAKLNYKINDYFNVFARIGGDVLNVNTETVNQVGHHFYRDGRLNYSNSRNSEFNADFLGTFTKDLTEKFNLTAMLGGNLSRRTNQSIGVSGSQFKIPTRAFYANTNIQSARYGPESVKKVNSLYAAVNMSWDNFLYLDVTGRNDWSSTLDEANFSYFYPSLSLSVLVDRFIDPDKDILNLLKARVSWAQVGNDTKVYQIYQTYSVTSQGYLGLTTLNAPSVKYNIDLAPETITSSEFGIEYGLWRNRLYGDFSIYQITTTDMIFDVPVTASTGYRTFRSNIGKVENSGYEVLIGGIPVRNENFTWDVSLNFSQNNNKMVELIDGLDGVVLNSTNTSQITVRADVGGSIGDIYGTTWAEDENGNKLVTAEGIPLESEGQVKLGNASPDWIGGLTNNFTYKGFNLRILIDGRYGGQIYSHTSSALDNVGVSERSLQYREGGVIVDAINTDTGVANTEEITGQQFWGAISGMGEPYVYEQTNFRLREFSLMYNLTSEDSRKIGMTSASFGLVGRNLFFIYKEADDIDPESTLGTTLGSQGISSYNVPTVRSFGLSINLKF